MARLEQAVNLLPTDPEINDHLADAYWRIGKKDQAKFHRTVAAALDGEGAVKALVPPKLAEGLPPLSPTTSQ